MFGQHIRHRAYSSDDIFFWLDKWLEDAPLANLFPMLFA